MIVHMYSPVFWLSFVALSPAENLFIGSRQGDGFSVEDAVVSGLSAFSDVVSWVSSVPLILVSRLITGGGVNSSFFLSTRVAVEPNSSQSFTKSIAYVV